MRVLMLCHRVPYPPAKGDKIRAWHLLRGIAARAEVQLGTFVDDPLDWEPAEALNEICEDVFLRPLPGWLQRLRALRALPGRRSLSVACYADRAMARWVAERLPAVDAVLIYSSVMAQYVPAERGPGGPVRVADYVDVDSEKWRQYAAAGGLTAPIHSLEARRLAAFERVAAGRFDRVLFVSDDEARCFLTAAPEHEGRVAGLPNGVDTVYFRPGHYDNPYTAGGPVAVFTGAMDYAPNVEAVVWFARAVLPRLQAHHPGARFVIVGMKPTAVVRALAELPGVTVTGRVPDIRPYLAHARASVAPLRLARGVQNKILEALAMGSPVVATPPALEGLTSGCEGVVEGSEDPEAFARRTAALFADPDAAAALGARGREHVATHYSWLVTQQGMDAALGLEPVAVAPSAVGVSR